MEIRKIKLMFIVLFGGVSMLSYTSDPMEMDAIPAVPVHELYRVAFRGIGRSKHLDVYEGMKYSELDGYIKGLFDIPVDARLRIIISDDQSRFIDLWEHPDKELTHDDLAYMMVATIINVRFVKA